MNVAALNYEIVELGDPRLRETAGPVNFSDSDNLKSDIERLRTAMSERGGVGIAAPQIGIPLQILIVASRPNARYPDAPQMEPLLIVNPKILSSSDSTVALWEGCLSVPGLRGKVTRPEAVTIEYFDLTGFRHVLELSGFPARIFLHEYDHLIGKTFVDRVESVSDLVTDKVYMTQVLSRSV